MKGIDERRRKMMVAFSAWIVSGLTTTGTILFVDTRAYIVTNPTDEPITSGLPVNRKLSTLLGPGFSCQALT
jgi:hypothetical protein